MLTLDPAQTLTPLRRHAFADELENIANWWGSHSPDHENGGFYGEISNENQPVTNADKGIILNTRILWFFSETFLETGREAYRKLAKRAYDYIVGYFIDEQYGGVVWALDAHGKCVSDRKQTYAQSFAVYALSAYARAFNDDNAKVQALSIARAMEQHTKNKQDGGYIEAFAKDWAPIEDVRLSSKDKNAPHTMNTHLHILEAYTGLHQAIGTDETASYLGYILDIFVERFIAPKGDYLALFYTEDWQDISDTRSFGHDIEAAWLVWEAAEILDDKKRLEHIRPFVERLGEAVLKEGIDQDGAVINEVPINETGHLDITRHWWVQAEAIVGFYNAFQLTGSAKFLDTASRIWGFAQGAQIDREHGEWRWLSAADKTGETHYKAGFWKAPYHNGRAMLEMMRRL